MDKGAERTSAWLTRYRYGRYEEKKRKKKKDQQKIAPKTPDPSLLYYYIRTIHTQ